MDTKQILLLIVLFPISSIVAQTMKQEPMFMEIQAIRQTGICPMSWWVWENDDMPQFGRSLYLGIPRTHEERKQGLDSLACS